MAAKQTPKVKAEKTVTIPGGSRKNVKEYDMADLEQLAKNSRREALKAQGQAPFFKLPVGTTHLELLKQRARVETNKWGKEQAVFRVVHDDEEYDLALPLSSSVTIALSRRIREGRYEVSIVRAGEGQNTTYSILEG